MKQQKRFAIATVLALAALLSPATIFAQLVPLERFAGGQFDATEAIQSRIDALPRGSGVPDGKFAIGGVVQIPSGTFLITRPLRVPSAVALVGQGTSTVLHCKAEADSAAILIVSPYTNGANIAARIEKLCINTDASRGIAIDTTVTGAVEDLILRDLYLNTANVALDLWPTNTKEPIYAPELSNIRIVAPGARAIRLRGRIASIRAFKINNLPREKFAAPDDAMCVFDGSGTIEDSWFEGDFSSMLGIFRGWWTFRGNWFEQHANAPSLLFCDGTFSIDQLFFFHRDARMMLKNADVFVSGNIEYRNEPDAIWIDEKSHLVQHGNAVQGIRPPAAMPSIDAPTTQAAK